MSTPPEEVGGEPEARAELVVSVEAAEVAAVADRRRAAGMDVVQTLDGLGVVTGSAAAAIVDTLEAIEGVTSVERSRSFQLPPPDAPVQ